MTLAWPDEYSLEGDSGEDGQTYACQRAVEWVDAERRLDPHSVMALAVRDSSGDWNAVLAAATRMWAAEEDRSVVAPSEPARVDDVVARLSAAADDLMEAAGSLERMTASELEERLSRVPSAIEFALSILSRQSAAAGVAEKYELVDWQSILRSSEWDEMLDENGSPLVAPSSLVIAQVYGESDEDIPD